MNLKRVVAIGFLMIAGCGGTDAPRDSEVSAEPAKRENVFDPLVSTIGRAQGVQQTVDEQAEEQRRQIEAAER